MHSCCTFSFCTWPRAAVIRYPRTSDAEGAESTAAHRAAREPKVGALHSPAYSNISRAACAKKCSEPSVSFAELCSRPMRKKQCLNVTCNFLFFLHVLTLLASHAFLRHCFCSMGSKVQPFSHPPTTPLICARVTLHLMHALQNQAAYA